MCVVDASVLIDLEDGGLLAEVSGIDLDPVTTDVIKDEFEAPGAVGIADMGIEVVALSEAEVANMETVLAAHTGLSSQDASALAVCLNRGLTLLAGDGLLRRIAEQKGLSVHGTLWLLDRMFEKLVLSGPDAADALERMLAKGSRLPLAECEKRLKQWRAA